MRRMHYPARGVRDGSIGNGGLFGLPYRLLIITSLLLGVLPLKEDSHYLLVLQESDFPDIFQQFSHLVI